MPDSEVIASAFLPLGPLEQGAFVLIRLGQAGKKTFAATGVLGSDSAGEHCVGHISHCWFGVVGYGPLVAVP